MTDVRLRRHKPGPGGVDDGLPQMPDGEPLLQRWYAIAMVILVPVALAVTGWVFFVIADTAPTISPAERRPPGSATVSHDRGDAVLNEVRESEAGPGCSEEITIVGDESARAAARRALSATCQLIARPEFADAARGLDLWADEGGVLRLAVFELTGVESSSRVEDGAIVIELNAKYQFVPGAYAAPAIVHELVHIAYEWPGQPVTAETELRAVELEHAACERLTFREATPRTCTDAAELLDLDDPLEELVRAGYARTEDR